MSDFDVVIDGETFSNGSIEALKSSLTIHLKQVIQTIDDLEGVRDNLKESLETELIRSTRRCGVCKGLLVDISPLIHAAKIVLFIGGMYGQVREHLPQILSTYGDENWSSRFMETDSIYQCTHCGAAERSSTHYGHVYRRRDEESKATEDSNLLDI